MTSERSQDAPPAGIPAGNRRSFRGPALAIAALWVLLAMGTLPHVWVVGAASIVVALLGLRLSPGRSKQLAINVIVFSVLLAGADLVLRGFAGGMLYYRAHDRLSRPTADNSHLSRYVPMVDVVMEERGDLGAMKGDRSLAEPRTVRFVTDQLGFRNFPMTSEPYEVLVIGDSFGVGIGTSQEHIFPTLLQERHRLGRSYSLSMPGGPWEGYANFALMRRSIPLKPGGTLLWLIFPGNDFDDTYHAMDVEGRRKSSIFARGAVAFGAWRKESFVGHVLRRVVRKGNRDEVFVREHAGNKILFYARYDAARRRTGEEWANHRNAPAFLATLDAMRGLATEMSLKLTIAVVPPKEEVYGWIVDGGEPQVAQASPFVRYLSPIAEKRGIPLIDLGPDLAARAKELAASGRYVYWRDDTHLNDAGHEVVAESLARVLRRGTDPK